MPLSIYAAGTLSKPAQWLTVLHLMNLSCSRSEIVGLYQLTNLAALIISDSVLVDDEGIDDTIFRAWARHAYENGGFQNLAVLSLNSRFRITKSAIISTLEFPSLHFLILRQMDLSMPGWKPCDMDQIASGLTTEINEALTHIRTPRLLGLVPASQSGLAIHQRDSIPMLNLCLGGSCPVMLFSPKNDWAEPWGISGSPRLYQRDESYSSDRASKIAKRRSERDGKDGSRKRQLKASKQQDAASSLEELL